MGVKTPIQQAENPLKITKEDFSLEPTQPTEKAGATGPDSAPQGDKLGLEEIVRLTNKVGLEHAEAKRHLDHMDLMKPTMRARVAIRLDTGGLSETKLRRLTETDPEYVDYIEKLVKARNECDKLRVRYESYKNLFDARRSMLSYQKAELKLI